MSETILTGRVCVCVCDVYKDTLKLKSELN